MREGSFAVRLQQSGIVWWCLGVYFSVLGEGGWQFTFIQRPGELWKGERVMNAISSFLQ